ncbi:hypothetical protein BaRGS_00020178 [Batillaria attramentaria]|uniref:CARD domain-containing protein n=1 Tax=Batillaria attramentaria TaxID=370345 RepID=A0ABD0KMT6_9CAEN
MPVKKGRLRPQDRIRITKNYPYLLETLDPDEFMDYLISSFVLDSDDRDLIKNGDPKTRKGRVERFLQILERAGEDAYGKFLNALEASGNDHVVKKLQETDISDVNTGAGSFSWIDDLPNEIKNQRVTDQHASRLSAALGNNWQQVFFELGVRQAKIQQTQDTYKNSVPTAITTLLIGWRQKEASRATFLALLTALRQADDRCTIEWDLVQSIVEGKT